MRVPINDGQMGVYGPGEALTLTADTRQDLRHQRGWEVLVLGGRPLREPIARYGPFVMNTKAEIMEAVEDFNAGRLVRVAPVHASVADEEVPPA